MNLKCLFGSHQWEGCKCSACGKSRDQEHDWSKDCEKCMVCGGERSNAHSWAGCKCSACGKTRDEEHDWSKDCEKCTVCGAQRSNAHGWSGCKCDVCGKIGDERHDWSKDCETCAVCGTERLNAHNWGPDYRCSACGATTDADSLLLQAAKSGDVGRVNALIASGDVNVKDSIGSRAVRAAAYWGQVDCVKALVAAGAEYRGVNDDKAGPGYSLLEQAADEGNVDRVNALIAAGADVRANGSLAIVLAVGRCFGHCVKALLAAGADANATNSLDWPVLVLAVQSDDVVSVKALIAAGADVNTRGGAGTLLRLAKRGERPYTNFNYEFTRSIDRGAAREEIIAALVAAGATL